MFINNLNAPITDKNLPSSWCNAFLHWDVVNEPPIRGHPFFMARGNQNKIPIDSFLNKKYGRLTITKETLIKVYPNGARFRRVEAICDCGVVREYNLLNILHGRSASCGCFLRENPAHVTHGLSKTPIYRIYNDIKTRCYNKNSDAYHWYGAKGVKMCDEWLNDFVIFYDWVISNGYRKGLTVDRYPNKLGNYDPSNCRLATMKTQFRNRTSNVQITFNGETKIAVEWAEQYGIDQDLFQSRRKRGWSIEECLTIPAKRLGRKNRVKTN